MAVHRIFQPKPTTGRCALFLIQYSLKCIRTATYNILFTNTQSVEWPLIFFATSKLGSDLESGSEGVI